jgi:hypothetical protein
MVPELMRNGWNFVKLCGCLNKIVHLWRDWSCNIKYRIFSNIIHTLLQF